MLAHMFPAAEPEANMCTHKDILPTDVGHAKYLGKLKRFVGSRVLQTGSGRVCMGVDYRADNCSDVGG